MIENTQAGLYCRVADFYIDPWKPVKRAVITHAHADHARSGCGSYLATPECARLLRARLGGGIRIEALPYGKPLTLEGIQLSLHPAGHILGSAQVRIDRKGELWVVTGDFKRHPDPTCTPFEPVRCHALVTESTFGLPVFNWPDPQVVVAAIDAWWRKNTEHGQPSILFAYSLGKAQRIAAQVDAGIGPIFTHGAVEPIMEVYRQAGIPINPTQPITEARKPEDFSRALVIAPPSAAGSPWMRRFPDARRAFASGWMQIRGNRRRRAIDRGFVLSDHTDWSGLLDTIDSSSAGKVLVTHGFAEELVQFLREKGLAAEALQTVFRGEADE
jgi:putative mRNA 3-end processing factor